MVDGAAELDYFYVFFLHESLGLRWSIVAKFPRKISKDSRRMKEREFT